jgi:hypothetical protein
MNNIFYMLRKADPQELVLIFLIVYVAAGVILYLNAF